VDKKGQAASTVDTQLIMREHILEHNAFIKELIYCNVNNQYTPQLGFPILRNETRCEIKWILEQLKYTLNKRKYTKLRQFRLHEVFVIILNKTTHVGNFVSFRFVSFACETK
jgi:hypothetical protein